MNLTTALNVIGVIVHVGLIYRIYVKHEHGRKFLRDLTLRGEAMGASYLICVGTLLFSKNTGITGTALILSSFLSLGTCLVSWRLFLHILQGLAGMYLLLARTR